MPSLTFITEHQCPTCGHVERGRQFAWGCRINKNSIAVTGSLNAQPARCVECGNPVSQYQPDRLLLDDESLAKVTTARARRGWITT